MLTCPHCKSALTPAEVAQQHCPHCQRAVSSGQATVDTTTGQVTLDLTPGAAENHGTNLVVAPEDKSWDSQTVDPADLRASDSRASRDSFSPTIDSVAASVPSAAALGCRFTDA